MNARKLAAVLVAAIMTCSLVGCAGSSADGNQGITVTASYDMKVVPDKARITIAVVTEGDTAEACQNDNAEATNAVIEALGKLGVEDKNIQTANTYLSPRYGQPKDGDENSEYVITGYEMTTSLRVDGLDIDNVGAAIQTCIAAGANEANGIEYYASNYDEAYQQALETALGTAKSKAEGIASASGVSLGKVTKVVEGYQDTSARYAVDNEVYEMAKDSEASGAMAKTMPGQTNITAEVTVTYAIK